MSLMNFQIDQNISYLRGFLKISQFGYFNWKELLGRDLFFTAIDDDDNEDEDDYVDDYFALIKRSFPQITQFLTVVQTQPC